MDGKTLSAAMGGSLPLARYNALAPAVTEALVQAGCTTVVRAAMLCAQVAHESLGLRYMEEIASGSAYEGRKDLGNTHKGDGVRYKGRGPIQVTGRANYTSVSKWAYSKKLVPTATYFVDNPTQLASDKYGFLGVVWYWTVARNMNSYADNKDINGATKAINGGLNGLGDRGSRYAACLKLGSALITKAAVSPSAVLVDGQPLDALRDMVTGSKGPISWRGGRTCSCVTQAIALAEAKLKALGVIHTCLDFYQFGYNNGAVKQSAGTHDGGGVVDVKQIDDVTQKVLREVGFSASWYRGPGSRYGNFTTKHIHAVLNGCPHVSAGAKSQTTDVLKGGNGLGKLLHGPDYGVKVTPITWQNAQTKYIKKPQAPKPTKTTTKDEGVLGMTDRISFRNTKAQKIVKANTLQWLRIDKDAHVSIAFGPAKLMANITLVVSGLTPKDSLYVAVEFWDVKSGKAKRISGDDVLRITGNQTGWVETRIPVDAYMGKKNANTDYKAMRIRVKSNTTKAVVRTAEITGWKS